MDDVISSADGTRLAVRRAGSGTPVVLLHGSGGGLHSWAAVAARLADEYEVWLVARRGHGPSDVPSRATTSTDEVDDVRAVLAAAGTGGPVHLVGASHGATVALHAALADPADVRSLALYEPPLFAAGPRLAPVLAGYRARLDAGDLAGAALLFLGEVAHVPSALLAALASGGGGDPAETARSAVGSLHDLEAMAADSGDLERWSAIEVPVVLLQGADSWPPLPATMDALARSLPHAERVVWQGQTHFASNTAPDVVADTLRGSLARH